MHARKWMCRRCGRGVERLYKWPNVEGETSAVVVTDLVGIRPSDAGSRTEQMLESLLTK